MRLNKITFDTASFIKKGHTKGCDETPTDRI